MEQISGAPFLYTLLSKTMTHKSQVPQQLQMLKYISVFCLDSTLLQHQKV